MTIAWRIIQWTMSHRVTKTKRLVQGALLMVLFQVSHTVEHRLTQRASGSLVSLLDRMPQGAHKLEVDEDGRPDINSLHMVPASDMQPGQFLLVRPGEQVRHPYPDHGPRNGLICAQQFVVCNNPFRPW